MDTTPAPNLANHTVPMDPERAALAQGVPATTMTQEQVSAKLREVALFQGLGDADLLEILRISESIRVDGGEYVFQEGERGDHFFIIVQGRIELRKVSGGDQRRLAVLKEGQAFGEMALLNQTPRSASAYALEDTYMLSVSRASFNEILGGDTLSVRLLKNLSKALWATSVRLAAQQAKATPTEAGHETLSEFNRLLRARLLPRVTPRVSGFDVSASTLAPRRGAGSTSWDWFVLPDGRPAFCVVKAVRGDLFSAQRLAAVRLLVRTLAVEPNVDLGSLVMRVGRGLRSGWIEGLSGSVALGVVALADGAAEWVEAGPVTGMLAVSDGAVKSLGHAGPPLGEDADHRYESTTVPLDTGDRIVALTGIHANASEVVESVLVRGPEVRSRDALSTLLAELEPIPAEGEDPSDVSAAIVTRTATPSAELPVPTA